jgi:hypothetical protein
MQYCKTNSTFLLSTSQTAVVVEIIHEWLTQHISITQPQKSVVNEEPKVQSKVGRHTENSVQELTEAK